MTIKTKAESATIATRTIIATGTALATRAKMTLVHRVAGWEVAGAGTRDAKEGWGVLYEMRDGTTGGQWFRADDRASAVERFNLFTGESVA